ncbi:MAG TPA: hypothetical protein DCE80_17880 [Ignavibacteriales bacterium]|nr:hypothetical protein [Ignavibacteriales bacterium]
MKYTPNQYTPLPVVLTTFTASFAGSNVVLNWQTATEVNNYGFEVERTSPRPSPYQGEGGKHGRGWEKIGFVQGHGNSNSPKQYSFTDSNPPGGKIQYRLKQIDSDGKYEYSKVADVNIDVPTQFALEQNYPNPFNPTTKIKYSVPSFTLRQAQSDIHVTLKVYDVLGREVATLVDEEKRPGLYEVEWNGSDKPSGVSSKGGYASGVYFYKIQVGNCTAVRKMLLLR